MRIIWRSLLLVLALTLVTVPTMAMSNESLTDPLSHPINDIQQNESDDASVRVIPDEAVEGSSHTILVTGLEDNEFITVRIVSDETGNTVYETDVTANNRGSVEVSIFSEEGDAGEYTVEALNASGDVIGSDELIILAVPDLEVVFSVEPLSADIGEVFTIELEGAEPFAILELEVRDEAGRLVYSIRLRATVDGNASFEYDSGDYDVVGDLSVTVIQNEAEEIAQTSLTVTGELFPATIAFSPEDAVAGDTVFVTVTGLEPETDVNIVIGYQGEVITTIPTSSNVSGLLVFPYDIPADALAGDYTFEVEVSDGDILASSALPVTAREIEYSATIEFDAEDVSAGDTVFVTVTGLAPEINLTVLVGYEGENVASIAETSNVSGLLVLPYEIPADAPSGEYVFEIEDNNGEIVAQNTLVVGAADVTDSGTDSATADIGAESIDIDPLVAIQGERVEVIVTELPAGETVTLQVIQDGDVVFETDRTVNPDGTVALGLSTDEDDATGTYELNVVQGGEVIASSIFELVGADEPIVRATLEISPETAPAGSDHVITVDDLDEGQSVDIVVELDGETIFETERQAGADGTVVVVLSSDGESDLGVYDVTVTVEDTELTGTLEITEGDVEAVEEETETDDPTLTIDPTSGPVGTEHTISVSGLNPNEEFVLEIEFDGDVVFSITNIADSNGEFETVIFSEETDPAGDYDLFIIREDGDELTATLTIEGDEEDEEDEVVSEVEITVSPESAELGEVYEFEVTGLEPESEFDVVVEFDGEVLFETTREADEEGVFTIILETTDEDEPGEYTFSIIQDGETIGSVEFEAVASETDEVDRDDTDVEVTVEPDSAELGGIYLIEVTGLESEEDITLIIEFDGDTVFETELTADEDGVAQLEIVSEEGDEAGEYVVIIERDGDDVAEATFDVTIADEDEDTFGSGDDAFVLSEDVVTFEGELTNDNPEAEFVFSGEAGQQVTIDLTSGDFDTFLILLDDNGDEIASDDDSGDGLNSRIRGYTLPYTGNYTIVVSSFGFQFGDVATGDYELSVSLFVSEEVEVELGEGNHFVNGTLTDPTPEISYIFEGDEGDTVLISMSSNILDTYLLLLDEDGNQLAVNDDSNGTLNSQIGPFTLPYDGDYIVIATSFSYANSNSVATGDFALSIEVVESVDVEYGDSVDLEFDEDVSTHFIYFEGETGDIISIIADSDGSIDTMLMLANESGFEVASDDDGGSGFDPEIERVVLSSSGTYLLRVSSFTPGDEGDVEVTINLEDTATLDVDEVREVRLNEKFNEDVIYIDGEAGETITLEIELESGDVGFLAVVVEQDFSTLMRYETQGLDGTVVLTFDVNADGEISIFFREDFAGNAIFNVEISRD